jgi:hypothetical protein
METDYREIFASLLNEASEDKNWLELQNQAHLIMRYTVHVNSLKQFLSRYCVTPQDFAFMMKMITMPPQKVEVRYK